MPSKLCLPAPAEYDPPFEVDLPFKRSSIRFFGGPSHVPTKNPPKDIVSKEVVQQGERFIEHL